MVRVPMQLREGNEANNQMVHWMLSIDFELYNENVSYFANASKFEELYSLQIWGQRIFINKRKILFTYFFAFKFGGISKIGCTFKIEQANISSIMVDSLGDFHINKRFFFK